MLVLTRRIGEKVVIGSNVSVTVVSCAGNQVRLGIDAPEEIAVDREEVRERKCADVRVSKPRDSVRGPTQKGLGNAR